MAGLDPRTGRPLEGLDDVISKVQTIFTTGLGERVMREWFGNPGIRLLGENVTEQTILRWWTITWACLAIFEPRLEVRGFKLVSADRLGAIKVRMSVLYRPYAHLDFVQAELYVSLSDGVAVIREAA